MTTEHPNAKAIRLLEEWRAKDDYRDYVIYSPCEGDGNETPYWKVVFYRRVVEKAQGIATTLLAAVEDALRKWEGET